MAKELAAARRQLRQWKTKDTSRAPAKPAPRTSLSNTRTQRQWRHSRPVRCGGQGAKNDLLTAALHSLRTFYSARRARPPRLLLRNQNWPQPVAVGANDRVEALHATQSQLVCVIDLQNGVLLHHAKEQQQTQTGKDIHRLSGYEQRDNAERNRQRQSQQNSHRMDERFKLRRQHHVHENERKNDRQHEIVARASEFLRTA